MMGGHLDAFDVATGGVDCGSGSSVVLEAARLIMESGAKPKRSILVCLWAGEEFGLLGSKYWVNNNKDKLDKISNYFNRDGGPLVPTNITVPQSMYNDFQESAKIINSIDKNYPFELKVREGDIPQKPTYAGGSDHAYFAINGVPTLSLGLSDINGHNFSYGEIWHTERDTYDKSIEEYQKHAALVTAIMVYNLANLDHILSRSDLYK